MADTVTMYHPELPKGRTFESPAESVEHWKTCGWVVGDGPKTTAKAAAPANKASAKKAAEADSASEENA